MVDDRRDRLAKWRGLPWRKKWLVVEWRDLFLLALVLFLIWGYQHDVGVYRDRALHPCDYCVRCNPFQLNVTMRIPVVTNGEGDGRVVLPSGHNAS